MSAAGLIVVIGVFALAFIIPTIHQVEEGHVGIYFRGGALLKSVSKPGYHIKMPYLTTFAEVQVTVQTDSVTNIPCGTSGGVLVTFDKVEVVNRLREDLVYETVKNYTVSYDKTWIFDKIHHEINQFCSKHSLREVYIDLFDRLDEDLQLALQSSCDQWCPSLEIIAVRVTKPRIPNAIRDNFELIEAEKTKLLIAEQHQKVVEKEAETDMKKATIAAQKVSEVAKINMEKEIMQKEAQQKVAAIDNEMHLEKERAAADAAYYKAAQEAEANKVKLTPEFLEFKYYETVASNTKIYFGEKLPSTYIDRTSRQSLP